MVKESDSCGSPEEQEKFVTQAKTALLVKQMYVLNIPSSTGECTVDKYELTVVKEPSLEVINFEKRKPTIFATSHISKGVSVSFTLFNNEEIELLKLCKIPLKEMLSFCKKGSNTNSEKTIIKDFTLGDEKRLLFSYLFPASTTYLMKIKIECNNLFTQWSDIFEFTTPEFNDCCLWKKCPVQVDNQNQYSVGHDGKIGRKSGLQCLFWGIEVMSKKTITILRAPLQEIHSFLQTK